MPERQQRRDCSHAADGDQLAQTGHDRTFAQDAESGLRGY